ncbi:centrosomal protein kizuna-like [Pomacea canaliculata]|uniref:centrosomal protein kizuna-like n=1 Tax=Pomacea canaliculata TaxID=400727 RepID=UPI000D725800|nr:centrosomal protein kizuna-like [Pomacea canaliculata]
MASSNVEFYERQRDLQETVTKSEQERLQLEKQLKLLLKSEQNSSQMKATQLQTYWKKICADEKRAQQRNAMLMREFERIDAHLVSTAARTERLQFLKRQYADYIKQTYPEWTNLVEKKIIGGTSTPENPTTQAEKNDRTSGGRHSQEWTEAEKDELPVQVQEHVKKQQEPEASGDSSRDRDSLRGRTVLNPPQTGTAGTQNVRSMGKLGDVKNISSREISFSGAAGDVSDVRSVGKQQQQTPQQPSSMKQVAGSSQLQSTFSDNISRSEYANINQFSNLHMGSPHRGQGDYGTVDPGNEDELSDFGSVTEIPLNGGDSSPLKVAAERKMLRENVDEAIHSTGSLPPQLTIDGLIRLLHHIESDFASNGPEGDYYRSPILKTEDKENIIQLANASRDLSTVPSSTASHLVLEQISSVVRSLPEKCLIKEDLLKQPPEKLVLSDIGRNLTKDAQVLWTVLFSHFLQLLAARVMEANEIAAVFVPCLVMDRSLFQDKAFVLLVHLLKANDGEEELATDASSITSPHPPATPKHLGGSGSLTEDGRVPPLKFPGSLIDRPFSDDESSFFDQSLPKDQAVPLNETSAYQQMLTGTFSSQQLGGHALSDDTDDDDMEKEFASALSPRISMPVSSTSHTKATVQQGPEPAVSLGMTSPKSPVHVPTGIKEKPTLGFTGSSQIIRQGLKIGSDFDTDSEMDPRLYGSMKKPDEEQDDFDFYD